VKAYYDRRAPEYDEWYEGLGRFDGLERPRWDEEVRELESWQERILNDCSRWQVFKRYFTPEGLLGELGGGRILYSGRWFVAVEA
jgi:hypothetical protein